MLQGIRIVEIEGLGPGPFAGMMLADMGAEVIVIHRPASTNPTGSGPSLLDRGKRSIALDLKDAGALETARALITSADALIEGFRPGVMERLGLGPETFAASNPKLVYGRMTGWGQTGPRAMTAGHDLNYIATSGALWYAGTPGAAPVTPPTLVGDVGGGALYLVAGLLAGIINAGRTGQGTVVDAAIVDGSAHMMALLMSMAPSGNTVTERGQSLLDGAHWCRAYACADGGWISVQCLEPKFHAEFLSLMGLADDPDFADQYDRAHWPAQTDRLAAIFAGEPVAHWAALFEGSDACVAPVLSPQDAAADAHMAARAVWSSAGGTLQPAPAPRFGQATPTPAAPPERGADGEAIRKELADRGLI
ncbi:MAG: CaiB/BaiF CoA-transferase family protein [Roseovarius sp.]